ncbi:MAG: hypothetical protein ACREND_07955 [Gemmatimonadaceae bacterium]
MSFQAAMLTLRLVHVVAGICWAGAAVMFAGYVLPAARATGSAGESVMRELVQRRGIGPFFMISALITIASGIAMYSMIGAGSYRDWIISPMGSALGIGAIAATIAALVGGGIVAPASKRLTALGIVASALSGAPSPEHVAEVLRLQKRLGRSSALSAALLLIAVSAMAMARYI